MKILCTCLFLVFSLLSVVSCNNSGNEQPEIANEPVSTKKIKETEEILNQIQRQINAFKRQVDSTDSVRMVREVQKARAEYERTFRKIGLQEKIGEHTLDEYLSDPKIPRTFKAVFQQKQSLNDDDKTLAMLDSLFSKDKNRHPFYFALVTHAMWWSDGAFSEPLGMAAKDYVEKNTEQFLHYFSNETVLTQYDLSYWALYVVFELCASDDKMPEAIKKTGTKMRRNCKDCTPEEIDILDKFSKLMYKRWNEL